MTEVTPYQMLCITVGDLLANAGVMRAMLVGSEVHDPEVAERFDDKLSSIVEHLDQEVAEIQEFGSAFDEDDE